MPTPPDKPHTTKNPYSTKNPYVPRGDNYIVDRRTGLLTIPVIRMYPKP